MPKCVVTNRALLERVAHGDHDAMRLLLRAHAPLLRSLVARYAAPGREADDALQEILVEIWRSAPRFDPAIASERTFVAMIARRRLIDIRRRRLPPAPREAAPEARDRPALPADRRRLLLRAFATLSDDQQATLRLAVQQGLTHQQISHALGMPLGTVKSHTRRALIQLREIMHAREADHA